ncbi:hypothetical protein [Paenibacillus ginsengihumi]|uniref:hypothetical protein n=1 Tax=Paenibacillus ginsengihumi TaxID=431596 RepID=UPI0005948013|nr:hypothetical protein [Paenibacillus ginsengihumi]
MQERPPPSVYAGERRPFRFQALNGDKAAPKPILALVLFKFELVHDVFVHLLKRPSLRRNQTSEKNFIDPEFRKPIKGGQFVAERVGNCCNKQGNSQSDGALIQK